MFFYTQTINKVTVMKTPQTRGERLILVAKALSGKVGTFGSDVLGVNASQMSHYTTNRVDISMKNVAELYNKVGINPEWLLFGTGTPFADNDKGEDFKRRTVGNEYFEQYHKKPITPLNQLTEEEEKTVIAIAMKILNNNNKPTKERGSV